MKAILLSILKGVGWHTLPFSKLIIRKDYFFVLLWVVAKLSTFWKRTWICYAYNSNNQLFYRKGLTFSVEFAEMTWRLRKVLLDLLSEPVQSERSPLTENGGYTELHVTNYSMQLVKRSKRFLEPRGFL